MEIRQLIKRSLVTVEDCASIRDAARVMEKHNVGLLVVVDKDGKMIGVISERDIARLVAEGVDLDKTPVKEVVKREVVTIREDESVAKAALLMKKYGIRHLVVVNSEGKPIGVISIRDLVDIDTALQNIASVEICEEETTASPLKVTS